MSDDTPKDSVSFRCANDWCRHRWRASPDRVIDDPDDDVHPFRYFAACPICGTDSPQASWERSLFKAWLSGRSGPKTPEGIAAVTANLEGHPTPEEAKRTRFNALQHGLSSRVATYFPARPGKYAECESCGRRHEGCGKDGLIHCTQKAELFMRHQVAFETNDPGHMKFLNADMQASLRALMDNMIREAAANGVVLRAPKYYVNGDGVLKLAQYKDAMGEMVTIMEVNANPVLKPLIELLKANNMGLADMGMTPKVQEDDRERMGHLDEQKANRESFDAFLAAQRDALAALPGLIERSRERSSKDPVLIEHQQAEGGSDDEHDDGSGTGE